jgi:hypothetical protein
MEQYQPDVLIVWGKRLWQKLPYDNWHEDDAVSIDGYDIDNGRYILSNGHSVKALSVYHPSVGYSWDYWHEVFKKAQCDIRIIPNQSNDRFGIFFLVSEITLVVHVLLLAD